MCSRQAGLAGLTIQLFGMQVCRARQASRHHSGECRGQERFHTYSSQVRLTQGTSGILTPLQCREILPPPPSQQKAYLRGSWSARPRRPCRRPPGPPAPTRWTSAWAGGTAAGTASGQRCGWAGGRAGGLAYTGLSHPQQTKPSVQDTLWTLPASCFRAHARRTPPRPPPPRNISRCQRAETSPAPPPPHTHLSLAARRLPRP